VNANISTPEGTNKVNQLPPCFGIIPKST